MKKLITIIVLFSFLILSGCDVDKTESPANSGNMSVKKETLSSQNKDDIRSDLIALNAIVNSSNTKAMAMRKTLHEAVQKGDKSETRSILENSKTLLETMNKSLFDLNLKSQEVHEIRGGIYQGNRLAIKQYELYFKENKTKEENKELAQVQQQSVALQKTIGSKLDKLNMDYAVQ